MLFQLNDADRVRIVLIETDVKGTAAVTHALIQRLWTVDVPQSKVIVTIAQITESQTFHTTHYARVVTRKVATRNGQMTHYHHGKPSRVALGHIFKHSWKDGVVTPINIRYSDDEALAGNFDDVVVGVVMVVFGIVINAADHIHIGHFPKVASGFEAGGAVVVARSDHNTHRGATLVQAHHVLRVKPH